MNSVDWRPLKFCKQTSLCLWGKGATVLEEIGTEMLVEMKMEVEIEKPLLYECS